MNSRLSVVKSGGSQKLSADFHCVGVCALHSQVVQGLTV